MVIPDCNDSEREQGAKSTEKGSASHLRIRNFQVLEVAMNARSGMR